MIKSFTTDIVEFTHLFDQMDKFLFYKKIKSFFRTKEISSLVDDCSIDWKTSLNGYSNLLSKYFDEISDRNCTGFYHEIPELEILTKSKGIKYENNSSDYTIVHLIKGSVTLSVSENGNEYDRTVEESELILFPSNVGITLKELNSKKVCISSMGLFLFESTPFESDCDHVK